MLDHIHLWLFLWWADMWEGGCFLLYRHILNFDVIKSLGFAVYLYCPPNFWIAFLTTKIHVPDRPHILHNWNIWQIYCVGTPMQNHSSRKDMSYITCMLIVFLYIIFSLKPAIVLVIMSWRMYTSPDFSVLLLNGSIRSQEVQLNVIYVEFNWKDVNLPSLW